MLKIIFEALYYEENDGPNG